jgi:hypothetical protein
MWDLDFAPMWTVFFFFTLFIGADFVWVTWKSKVRILLCVSGCRYMWR